MLMILIYLEKKKVFHTYPRTKPNFDSVVVCTAIDWKRGCCVMSYSDPAHWRGRAEELRGLAEKMDESVSRQLMRKMAENYDRLAETADQRVKDSKPLPGLDLAALPLAVRSFARRKIPLRPREVNAPDAEIPSFLKQGPATATEVGHWLSGWIRKAQNDTM